MRPKDTKWWEMPVPTTAQSRIAYLDACQVVFASIPEQSCPSAEAVPTAVVPGGCRILRQTIATADPQKVPRNATFECAACLKDGVYHARAPVLANPFSSWLVFTCEACSERAPRGMPA